LNYYSTDVDPNYVRNRIAAMAGRLTLSGVLADYVWDPVYEEEEDEEEDEDETPEQADESEDGDDEDDEDEEDFDDEWEDDSPRMPRAARTRLVDLLVTFMGEVRRGENVPWTKGALARDGLFSYFIRRGTGEFDRSRRRPDHPLCPDRRTLDQYLGGLLDLLDGRIERAFAVLELLPAWL